MITSRNALIRWIPYIPSFGANKNRLVSHEFFAYPASSNRAPASSTATRYPFSISRRALTDPPNPDPMTTTSKSCVMRPPGPNQASTQSLRPADLLQQPERACHQFGEGLVGQSVRRGDREHALGGDRLRLDVPADPFDALPTAESGRPHAAHRGVDRPERRAVPFVDVDRAGHQLRGDRPAAATVPGPDARVQAVLALVRALDRLGLVGEPVDRDDRSERLVVEALHRRSHPGQHGRLVEQ